MLLFVLLQWWGAWTSIDRFGCCWEHRSQCCCECGVWTWYKVGIMHLSHFVHFFFLFFLSHFVHYLLTHCGLVMPYGDIELNQWLDSGNVFLPDDTKPLPESVSSVRSSSIHQRAISHEILSQPSDTKISLKITYLQFHSNLPEANEWT